jgi:rare lipoprotein A
MQKNIIFSVFFWLIATSFVYDTGVKTTTISYYSSKLNGRKTASGEMFDNAKLTAAHKYLPFSTMVKVTNPQNGNSVIVKINDRGPHAKNRDLDLTQSAFKMLGNIKQGIMKVEYEVLLSDIPKEDNLQTAEIQ